LDNYKKAESLDAAGGYEQFPIRFSTPLKQRNTSV
jgi:hypothetical protein